MCDYNGGVMTQETINSLEEVNAILNMVNNTEGISRYKVHEILGEADKVLRDTLENISDKNDKKVIYFIQSDVEHLDITMDFNPLSTVLSKVDKTNDRLMELINKVTPPTEYKSTKLTEVEREELHEIFHSLFDHHLDFDEVMDINDDLPMLEKGMIVECGKMYVTKDDHAFRIFDPEELSVFIGRDTRIVYRGDDWKSDEKENFMVYDKTCLVDVYEKDYWSIFLNHKPMGKFNVMNGNDEGKSSFEYFQFLDGVENK